MLSVLMALATGAAPIAQPTPEELGMLDSPAAFVDVCGKLAKPLPEDVAAEMAKAEGTEKKFAEVTLALSAMACGAVVRGVAETIVAVPVYRLANGSRVCVDPRLPVSDVVHEAVRLSNERPEIMKEQGITTPAFLLFVLYEMSDCQSIPNS